MAFLDKTGLQHLWSHILTRLNGKANIIHAHNRSDIADLKELVVSDDGNGNVTIECSYTVDANLSDLQSRVSTVESTLNENGFLVVSGE